MSDKENRGEKGGKDSPTHPSENRLLRCPNVEQAERLSSRTRSRVKSIVDSLVVGEEPGTTWKEKTRGQLEEKERDDRRERRTFVARRDRRTGLPTSVE